MFTSSFIIIYIFFVTFIRRRATVKSETKTGQRHTENGRKIEQKKKKIRKTETNFDGYFCYGVLFCVYESCKRLSSLISQNKRKLIKFLRKVLETHRKQDSKDLRFIYFVFIFRLFIIFFLCCILILLEKSFGIFSFGDFGTHTAIEKATNAK